jgi:hypothetical protein
MRLSVRSLPLTVGSLPPAVYWRRRAVVLGVLLVVIIIFWASCTGPSKSDAGANKTAATHPASPTASPSATGAAALPFPPPTFGATPTATATPTPTATPTGPAGNGTGAGNNGGTTGLPQCADADLSLIASPEAPSVPNGAYLKFSLKIKNITSRACTRDLGADHQELYLQNGTTKAWSSDVCNPAHGSEVVTMQPNIEHLYSTTWNGQASNNGCTNRKPPGVGKYELFARLDTKISEPAPVQLT